MRPRTIIATLLSFLMMGIMVASAPAQPGNPVATNARQPEDVKSLTMQYQEEVLAKTIYEAFAEKWGVRAFANIASRGETHHAAAVLQHLEGAGLPNPLEGMPKGTFAEPELQAMYARLLEQGTASLEGAIKAGLEFEEFDIAELRKLQEQTMLPSLRQTYAMLERGSHHHLQAFSRQAQMRSIAYDPKHLTREEFDAALAGSTPQPATAMGNPPGFGGGPAGGCCGCCMMGQPMGGNTPAPPATEPAPATQPDTVAPSPAPAGRGMMMRQGQGRGMGRGAGRAI